MPTSVITTQKFVFVLIVPAGVTCASFMSYSPICTTAQPIKVTSITSGRCTILGLDLRLVTTPKIPMST